MSSIRTNLRRAILASAFLLGLIVPCRADESILKSRVFSPVPVAQRSESGNADAIRQIRLDGDWDVADTGKDTVGESLAEAGELTWTPLKMPGSIQNALFEAGKIENPLGGRQQQASPVDLVARLVSPQALLDSWGMEEPTDSTAV